MHFIARFFSNPYKPNLTYKNQVPHLHYNHPIINAILINVRLLEIEACYSRAKSDFFSLPSFFIVLLGPKVVEGQGTIY